MLPGRLIAAFSISVFVTISPAVEPQQFIWTRPIPGATTNNPSAANSVAADSEGNVIVLGTIQGIAPGPDHAITNGGMFLKKFDASGALLWTCEASARGSCVALDVAGNAYVCGEFFDTASFGTTVLTNSDQYSDVFLAKYDVSGTFQWVRQFPGYIYALCHTLAVDTATNIVLCGTFRGTIDFGTTNLASADGTLYLAKLDREGTPLWVIDAGARYGYSIATAGNGDIFMAGFNAGDIFLTRYNAAGLPLWVRSAGGAYNNNAAKSIALDGGNSVYVTGYFQGTVTFGSTNLTSSTSSTGGLDAFVARYTMNGDLQWIRQIADSKGGGDGRSVAVADDGGVYVAGTFLGEMDFGVTNLTEKGYFDGFVARYNPAGELVMVLQGENVSGHAIAVDGFGNAISAANAQRDSMFAPFGVTNAVPQAVIVKIGERPTLGIVQSNDSVVVTWPKAGVGYVLESAGAIDAPAWTNLLNTASTPNQRSLSLPATSQRFFRLRSP